jgi:hypothetical protein
MYKYRLSPKHLEEADQKRIQWQEKRIALFKDIEDKLNELYPLIDNAKEKTIAYYQENPSSYAVEDSAETILSYLNDIEELLNK